MTIKELTGHFNITGGNQDEDGSGYKGTLELTVDET
ncbi:MAG: hypothetical protein ACJA1H_002861, partial [Glaciecola sp.]